MPLLSLGVLNSTIQRSASFVSVANNFDSVHVLRMGFPIFRIFRRLQTPTLNALMKIATALNELADLLR